MIRTCDGTDPNLHDGQRKPCTCGLSFDDVECSTIYPHLPLPPPLTEAQKDEFLAFLGSLETTS